MFSIPFTDSESSRGFQKKLFNIIDPLKEINNLGRSVSRDNYYRIHSAFSYGAKKLAQILVQPQHYIAKELHKFFANTMARHGGGPRLDVLDNIYAMHIHDNFDEYFDEHTDLTTSSLDGLKISTDSFTSQISCPNEKVDAVTHFAPYLFLSKSKQDDCSVRNPSLDSDKLDRSENQLVDKNEVVASSKTREVIRDQKSTPLSGDAPEIVNSSDLAGNYGSYIQYLQYGRSCFEDGFGMHALPMPPFADASYQNSIIWDSLLHYKHNGFSHHPNEFHPVYAVPPVFVPYGWEDVSKFRGTGTYFPNMNMPFQGYQPIKGRNHGPIRAPHNSGRNFVFTEPNVLDRSSHELSHHQVMVSSSDSYLPFSPHQNSGYHTTNELFIAPEAVEL